MPKTAVSQAVSKALKDARPRTHDEIARSAGMQVDRLRNLSYGNVHASDHEIAALRRAMSLPAYWPGSPPHLEGAQKGEMVSLAGTPLVSIPVVGNASAGGGIFNVDTEMRTVKVPASIAFKDTLGFVIDGDSMMPMMEEFDVAVFRKAARKVTGYVYLLEDPNEGVMVKLLTYSRGDWMLVSLNGKYPPRLVAENTEFLGVLVAFYRVRGTREKWEVDSEGLRPDL